MNKLQLIERNLKRHTCTATGSHKCYLCKGTWLSRENVASCNEIMKPIELEDVTFKNGKYVCDSCLAENYPQLAVEWLIGGE